MALQPLAHLLLWSHLRVVTLQGNKQGAGDAVAEAEGEHAMLT